MKTFDEAIAVVLPLFKEQFESGKHEDFTKQFCRCSDIQGNNELLQMMINSTIGGMTAMLESKSFSQYVSEGTSNTSLWLELGIAIGMMMERAEWTDRKTDR